MAGQSRVVGAFPFLTAEPGVRMHENIPIGTSTTGWFCDSEVPQVDY